MHTSLAFIRVMIQSLNKSIAQQRMEEDRCSAGSCDQSHLYRGRRGHIAQIQDGGDLHTDHHQGWRLGVSLLWHETTKVCSHFLVSLSSRSFFL